MEAHLQLHGAVTAECQPHRDNGLVVMLDPAGHPFCTGSRICDGSQVEINDDDLQMHRAKERLKVLVAVDEALRRYPEVLPLLSASANRDEAAAAVRSLLGVDAVGAQAVLDLQWSHLTVHQRRVISEERTQLQALVERGRAIDGDR